MDRHAFGEFACGFRPAYSSACTALKTETGRCKRHSNIQCRVCGGPATNECSYAGQFVCGTPLCNDCEGYTEQGKSSGAWGFMNHAHRRKPVERREKLEPREMQAGDL